jgi:hypothetical protein
MNGPFALSPFFLRVQGFYALTSVFRRFQA